MAAVYPAGPTTVPANLTAPTSKYRNRAWLATGGLVAFALLYLALSGWFAWTAWRLFRAILDGQNASLSGWIAAFGAAFLAVFMIKALFFVQHRYAIDAVEIKPEEQPHLFEFLQRLADDAGAPRAHRVFLSGRVNAAVFYDLSLLNLIVPSKKNLEVGLALVNALTLGELKAVLAHEFGHFAQRSMAVGRWVYIAQQIAGQIISRRDALDKFLNGLSRFDVRVAWIGWVLSLVIWSIRSLTETAFRVVLIAQRALSREMEFQADLVAVSLTGSDALIHALHKIGFAEYAWDRAVGFAAGEAQAGRRVQDVFALQTFVTQRMRELLADPEYGAVAEVPLAKPEAHRVFKQQLAQAPRMWSTHPSNREREENAKRTYVAAAIDDRSAWELFTNAATLRERISAELFKTPAEVKTVPLEESQRRLHDQYRRTYLDPQYRGAYLGRSIVRHAARTDELYDTAAGAARLSSLYPEPLAHELALLRNVEMERGALQALHDGFMEAPGGVIQHRGKELKRSDLPKAIEELEAELEAVQARVRAHDRLCRGAHLAVAKSVGAGWPEYLGGLLAILHYTDHTEADLLDAHGAFRNVFSIVTADGRVSNREVKRLLAACQQAWTPLQRIYEHAPQVALDARLLERLAIESWQAALGELKLVPPSLEIIGDWLGAIDSWVGHTASSLAALRLAALDELLLAERRVAELAARNGEAEPPPSAPPPSRTPVGYSVLLPGKERPRQKRLGIWDRFQLADGAWATAARLIVAAAMIGGVMALSSRIGESTVAIFNALDRPVLVRVDETSIEVPPFGARTAPLAPGNIHVTTTFLDGQPVEEFDEQATGFEHVVYSVAGAAPLNRWYSTTDNRLAPRRLGAVRWTTSDAAGFIPEPRGNISTSGEVSGPGRGPPGAWVLMLDDDADRARLIATHARLSAPNGRNLLAWLRLAAQRGEFSAIAAERLGADPHDITTLYLEQLIERDDAALCERRVALASANPGDGDYRFLADLCASADAGARSEAFAASFATHPESGWLAFAVGSEHSVRAHWEEAIAPLELARRAVPPLAEDIALVLARVRRMTMDDPDLSDLASDSLFLRFLLDVEAGRPTTPAGQAYGDIHRGDVAAAAARSLQARDLERVLRLGAASDGAPADVVQRALRLPIDTVEPTTTFALVGVLLRERQGADTIRDIIGKTYPRQLEPFMGIVEAIEARDFGRVDRQIEIFDPALRGQVYGMATTALGKDTPRAWREAARRLSFATERPYFAPSTE